MSPLPDFVIIYDHYTRYYIIIGWILPSIFISLYPFIFYEWFIQSPFSVYYKFEQFGLSSSNTFFPYYSYMYLINRTSITILFL